VKLLSPSQVNSLNHYGAVISEGNVWGTGSQFCPHPLVCSWTHKLGEEHIGSYSKAVGALNCSFRRRN
jgi:hypothetical protein